MKTKNALPIDQLESAYLADVKSIACIVCAASPPSSAHHPDQGLHFNCIALCVDCHTGQYGWHGDKSLWHTAKMTERKAINETRRGVEILRRGGNGAEVSKSRPAPRATMRKPYRRSDKIVPREVFQ